MFFFGHLGIGYRLGRRAAPSLGWLLGGTLVPDLLDKSLLLASDRLWVHPPLLADPFLSGTRTIGHTLLFTLAILSAGRFARSSRIQSLGTGMATHLFLDCFGQFLGVKIQTWEYVRGVLFWPLFGPEFPVKLWTTRLLEFDFLNPQPLGIVVAELVGLALLVPLFLPLFRRRA